MTDETQQLRTQLAEQRELTRQIALQRDMANNELARCRAQLAVREQIIAALQQQMPEQPGEAAPPPRTKKKPANGAEKAPSA